MLLSFGYTAHATLDGHFTQYKTAGLYYNPALAGSTGKFRSTALYREQWPGLSSRINQLYVGVDHALSKSGLGMYYLQDNLADRTLIHTRFALMYNYRFIIGEKLSITPAIKAQYFINAVDVSKLTFGDQIDPVLGFVYSTQETLPNPSSSGIDFGSGLLIHTQKWNIGLSMDHLTEPEVGVLGPNVKWDKKYVVHGAYNFAIGPGKLNTGLMWAKHGLARETLLTTTYQFGKFLIGIGYRVETDALALIGYKGKTVSCTYSYDYTLSQLGQSNTLGSHEVSLGILLDLKKSKEGD